ncbi:nonribosomal peptide synthetase/polyketide synthase [Escherichia coli]|nr:nonribosomal peptide synthetase/polyketide synthase [Escherichia coli]
MQGETIPDIHRFYIVFALVYVTNGAIVIHTQRLKSDPGGNLLS